MWAGQATDVKVMGVSKKLHIRPWDNRTGDLRVSSHPLKVPGYKTEDSLKILSLKRRLTFEESPGCSGGKGPPREMVLFALGPVLGLIRGPSWQWTLELSTGCYFSGVQNARVLGSCT